jgi:hypothetical protein
LAVYFVRFSQKSKNLKPVFIISSLWQISIKQMLLIVHRNLTRRQHQMTLLYQSGIACSTNTWEINGSHFETSPRFGHVPFGDQPSNTFTTAVSAGNVRRQLGQNVHGTGGAVTQEG